MTGGSRELPSSTVGKRDDGISEGKKDDGISGDSKAADIKGSSFCFKFVVVSGLLLIVQKAKVQGS
jgi:hypothetical protein